MIVSDDETKLAQLAVALGLAARDPVEALLAARREGKENQPLLEALVATGLLLPADAVRLQAARQAIGAVTATQAGPGLVGPAVTHAGPDPAGPAATHPAPRGDSGAPVAGGLTPLPGPRAPGIADGILPETHIGRFEVLDAIGRGGMGVVFRARQIELDRIVALKVLAPHAQSQEEIERFRREARSVARLRHPGIVEIHDVGEFAGRPYIVMEYVEGRSLDRHLAQTNPDLRTRADLVRRVAEAVQAAHDAGIIHRDLKPTNVLVDPQGRPKVADFGLAKEIGSTAPGLTESGMVVGTPNYMSPEQADGRGRHVDVRTDVFSLGVMLYEVLTGKLPFVGESALEVLMNLLGQEALPPRRWNSRIHVDLETICLKALEKDRERRYGTAREFAEELGRFLAGEPIFARPLGTAGRMWRRARRHPATSALAAVLTLTLAAGGATAWRSARRDLEAEREKQALVDRYVGELARSGRALVDAALARRALGDLGACTAYKALLEEPVQELIRLAPERAEPWYHRGRMARAQGEDEDAERLQTRAIELGSAPDAPAGSRAILPHALYERGVLRAVRHRSELGGLRVRTLRDRATGGEVPPAPTQAELDVASPELVALKQRFGFGPATRKPVGDCGSLGWWSAPSRRTRRPGCTRSRKAWPTCAMVPISRPAPPMNARWQGSQRNSRPSRKPGGGRVGKTRRSREPRSTPAMSWRAYIPWPRSAATGREPPRSRSIRRRHVAAATAPSQSSSGASRPVPSTRFTFPMTPTSCRSATIRGGPACSRASALRRTRSRGPGGGACGRLRSSGARHGGRGPFPAWERRSASSRRCGRNGL